MSPKAQAAATVDRMPDDPEVFFMMCLAME
jgi:hypothetical protein